VSRGRSRVGTGADRVRVLSVKLQFGRCSVRTHFKAALKVLNANKQLFRGFVEHRIGLNDAEEVSLQSLIGVRCPGTRWLNYSRDGRNPV
jgi:multisubunit Na+/H+ antiporter MnhE subunit